MKSYYEKEKNFISIVVYMRNCEDNIAEFITKTDKELSNNFQLYEFILVDDYSDDDTIKQVNHASKDLDCNISVIKMAHYHGIEKSIHAGVDLAIGDFVYEFDTTIINYNINLIYKLYEKSLAGYDVVVASPGESARTTSKTFYRFLSKISYFKIKLYSETFRLVSRRMINRAAKNKGQIIYRKAVYHYSGLESATVFYKPLNSLKTETTMNLSQRTSLAMDVLMNYSNIGIRIAGFTSVVFLILAIATIIYTVYTYITLENIQPGWATTMLFLSVSFAGLFFILFIITKYLVNILIEVRKEPKYVYKSIVKIRKGKGN